jgi:ankyrin repeat protein
MELAGDAFYAAIRANDLTSLAALLKAGADPNAAEPRGGMTPLMHTAVSGSLDAMRMLLDKGASVNAANGAGLTALMMSVTDATRCACCSSVEPTSTPSPSAADRRCSWRR